VLPLAADETLEVQQPGARDWVAWQARESFAGSGPEDRHFVLDLVSGELELGPAVRQSDAAWRQYGAVPPKGSVLRVSSYRHGGGRKGNVAEHTLTVLKSAIAGVATVANPRAATGGVDAETLDAARRRAALEIRARDRAVTAADFEFLAGEASPRVARTLCVGGDDGAPVTVRLLPHAEPPDRRLEYDELVPDEALFADVAAYLDERRLIGTRVELQPVRFRGVSVVVNLQSASSADPVRVEQDVGHALYTYLNPLVGGSVTGRGTGWPFGRPLNQGELYGVIHAIEGVDHVKVLRLYETDLTTGEQSPQPTGTHILLEPDELLASGRHIVKATRAIG
jgi:predicted phage baseplate assembly protein